MSVPPRFSHGRFLVLAVTINLMPVPTMVAEAAAGESALPVLSTQDSTEQQRLAAVHPPRTRPITDQVRRLHLIQPPAHSHRPQGSTPASLVKKRALPLLRWTAPHIDRLYRHHQKSMANPGLLIGPVQESMTTGTSVGRTAEPTIGSKYAQSPSTPSTLDGRPLIAVPLRQPYRGVEFFRMDEATHQALSNGN